MEVVTDMTLKTYGRGQPDHCVVFRKGGTDNFTWHRSLAMTKVAAVTTAATCREMGYAAYVTNYAQSLSIGLPEGYNGTPNHCPRCDSPSPHLHPAVQFEGEVQPCSNPFHEMTTNQNQRRTEQ